MHQWKPDFLKSKSHIVKKKKFTLESLISHLYSLILAKLLFILDKTHSYLEVALYLLLLLLFPSLSIPSPTRNHYMFKLFEINSFLSYFSCSHSRGQTFYSSLGQTPLLFKLSPFSTYILLD